MEEPTITQKLQKQEAKGEQNYHLMCRFLLKMSRRYQSIIQGYQKKQNKNNQCHARTLEAVHQKCPTFLRNISEIIKPQANFKKETYDAVINELIDLTKAQLMHIERSLSEKDRTQYELIAKQNQSMFLRGKLQQIFKKSQWTASHMLNIDFLYTFLKQSNSYQGTQKMAISPIAWILLSKILNFKFQNMATVQHLKSIDFYENMIVDCFSEDLRDIILFLSLVQTKKRSGHLIKNKNINYRQILQSSTLTNQFNQFYQINNYQKYRFCQITYLFLEAKKFSQLRLDNQLQIAQKFKLIDQKQSIFRQKRQLLKLKVEYNVNFLSLIQSFKLFKSSNLKKIVDEEKALNIMEQCQWGFIKNADYATMKKISKQQICYNNFQGKNNPISRKLCQITMKRLSLLSTVIKAHQKIEDIIHRKSIYICHFQQFLSQFSQQLLQNEDNKKKVSIVIATDGNNILYAAIFEISVQQGSLFAQLIGQTIDKMGLIQKNNKINIIIYRINFTFSIQFINLRALLSRKGFDNIRVYYTALLEKFHIHFMIYMLVKHFLKMENVNKTNFVDTIKHLLSKILQSLHFSPKIRQNLSSISLNKRIKLKKDQDYEYFYKQQQILLQIQKTYQFLCKQMMKHNNNTFLWNKVEKMTQGQVVYFSKEEHFSDSQSQIFSDLPQSQITSNLPKKQLFANDYVRELKMRHPYLTNQEWIILQNNFQAFREQKNINIHYLKSTLKTIVRLLICYSAYYDKIIEQNQLGLSEKHVFQELKYLKTIYAIQEKRLEPYHAQKRQFIDKYLSKLFPQFRQQDYSEYFCKKYHSIFDFKGHNSSFCPKRLRQLVNQQFNSSNSLQNINFNRIFAQFRTNHKDRLQNLLKTDKKSTKRFQWLFIQKFSEIMKLQDNLSLKQYAQICNQIIQLIDLQYYLIEANLSQQETMFYQELSLKNLNLIEQSKDYFHQLNFTVQSMLKMDLLSIFFKIDHNFKKTFKVEDILNIQELNYIFGIRNSQLMKYKYRFEDNLPILTFRKEKNLEDIILFLFFIGIKLKIKQQKLIYHQIEKNQEQDKESDEQNSAKDYFISILQIQTHHNSDFQFNFCEIAYLPGSQQFVLEKNDQKLDQIKQKLQKITFINNFSMKKIQFLEFKKKYGIPTKKIVEIIQEVKRQQLKQALQQNQVKKQQQIKDQQYVHQRQQQKKIIQKVQPKTDLKQKDSQQFNDQQQQPIQLYVQRTQKLRSQNIIIDGNNPNI